MGESSYDLIDVMVKGADASYPDKELDALEHAACLPAGRARVCSRPTR